MTMNVFCALVCLFAGIFVLVCVVFFSIIFSVGLQSHYTQVKFARLDLLSQKYFRCMYTILRPRDKAPDKVKCYSIYKKKIKHT